MGLHYKKGEILLGLILFITAFVFASEFSLAQTLGCCIDDSGSCNNNYNQDQCTSISGTFFVSSCSVVPNCDPVCCKSGSNTWSFISKESCLRSGGTEYPDLNSNSCYGCADTETVIFGKAYYQDNTSASGAIVNISNASATVKLIYAGSDGSFSSCVPKDKIYTLTVTNPMSAICAYTNQYNVGSVSYNVGEINLPCLPTGGQCLTNWIMTWDDPVKQCGHRTVTDSGNCIPPSDNKPSEYVPCIIDGTLCPNNQLDDGEECDPLIPNIPGGNTCPEGYVGTISCSSNCVIQKNCLSCSGSFSNQIMCQCAEHALNPNCLSQCDSSLKISSFSAIPVYNGVKGIQLQWELPVQCSQSSVSISRCNANSALTGCNTTADPRLFNVGSVNGYLDTDFTNPTVAGYCYNITASGVSATGNYVISSSMVCTSLFDNECLDHLNEAYCIGKELIVCSGGKKISNQTCDCGCRDATMYPTPSPAQCVGTKNYCDLCDVCSGPFGVFSYPTNKGYYYNLEGINNFAPGYSTCQEVMASSGGYCYSNDYSRNKAIIGQLHSCFNVSSCYDYRAETSCESNPCGLSATQDCNWISFFADDELGLGVCIPEKEEEQDCKKCNELNILGGYCSPEICSYFGVNTSTGESTCYYNVNRTYMNMRIDNFSCMNIRDVACETYDTKEECVGASGRNFTINSFYGVENFEKVRLSGDNTYRLPMSDDLFGRGKCTWNPSTSKCTKDSDTNALIDCSLLPGKKNDDCFLDFTNPETKLILFGEEMEDGSRYSAAEFATLLFTTSEKVLNTYVSVPFTGPVYPRIKYSTTASQGRTALINGIMALGAGDYSIYFYSEDLSHNLEFVKSKTLTIIPDLSGINILNNTNSVYDLSTDSYITNLTINIQYNSAETLNCRATLRSEEKPLKTILGDGQKVSPYLQWNYSYLPDGTYILNISCSDTHMQSFQKTLTFYIEADISMRNPVPRGKTFRAGNINIGINTNESATCYYNTIGELEPNPSATSLGNPWRAYTTTGGTTHTALVSESSTGMKYYYSACYYPNNPAGERWFTGNGGDLIYFAIDESAPEILVYNEADELYTGDNSEIVGNIYLRIFCEDSNPLLVAGKDYSFGCGNGSIRTRVYYERYPTKLNVALPPEESNLFNGEMAELEITAPESYVKTYLEIIATDIGGNTNSRTISLNNLRNLSYRPPEVFICNPDTGVCN